MTKENASKITLLLVDDDKLILTTLADGLRAEGFDVLEASSGEIALKLAREADPDLAICDVRMPGMSGLELAPRLREQSDVPFIFLSAYGDEDAVRLATEHGALGYLVKPVNVPEMLPTIRTALVRAVEIRKLRNSGEQLNIALSNSREASMAIGILMERHRLDRAAAYELLRDYARSNRRKLTEIAAELLDATETVNRVKPVPPNGAGRE
ncbi:MAG: response regulator [Burkholderiales bacterium]